MLSVHLSGDLFFFYCVMKGWKDMNWDTKFKINNQIFVLKIPRQLKPFITRWKPVSLQQKKNGELPHYINNTEVFQYMAGIA